ncbi:MAG: 50S ribosomal protein L29 [bacterium]|nr:50S ribosomal protein L29 [bacterium]MDZ4231357.1 50S ribosomal protein L29 [Patescibacteria group bacterium]
MKKSDIQKLTKKTVVDLQKDLQGTREELQTLRFDLATGKVKNIAKIHQARKKTARLLTFINQKTQENGKGK